MFYSDTILARKGPLASIWLAAHWDRRLTKNQIMATDVSGSLNQVMSGSLPPMALRLSGQLLLGASKIYHRKAQYLLGDCTDALTRLRLAAVSAEEVDLPAEQAKAAPNIITNPVVKAASQQQVLMDDSFDLEGFLNAPLSQIAKTAETPAQLLKQQQPISAKPAISKDEPLSFGGAGNDLLDEFAGFMGGDDEIEIGRRQTGSSMANNNLISTPELPRLQEATFDDNDMQDDLRSLKNSLPMSPLRTPKKQADEGDQMEPLFSSPQSSVKRRRQQDPTARRKRRVTILIDANTELTNSQLQAQIRDTEALLRGDEERPKPSDAGQLNLNDLLSKPGALLLPVNTDLSGAFAATLSLSSPKRVSINTIDTLGSPLEAMDVDVPAAFGDDDNFDLPDIPSEPAVATDAAEPVEQEDTSSQWQQIILSNPAGSVLNHLAKVLLLSVLFIHTN